MLHMVFARLSVLPLALFLLSTGCRDGGSGPRPDAGPRDAGPRADVPVVECATTGPENTAAACSNMCDDDMDGFTDCDDFDCDGIGACGDCTATTDMEGGDLCGNSLDDDCDGFLDCEDFGCRGTAACPAGPVEASNPKCANGMDDDGDGFIDCDDNDCLSPQSGLMLLVCAGEVTNAACSDGIDNDGDGDIDCADEDCNAAEAIVVCDGTSPASPLPTDSEWAALVMTRCTNGVNDDADGDMDTFTDCGDRSCQLIYDGCTDLIEATNATCSDTMDNDLDGLVDCDDPRCQDEGIVVCDGTTPVTVAPAEYTTQSNTECSNGADEDGDTRADCMDFGCSQNPDVTVCPGEANDELCSDGMDNDDNGFMDCMDFSCSRNPFVTVCESGYERCSDGIDNDGNGFGDCQDFACTPMSGRSPACFGG
jgi:hypothetical protein